MLFRESALSLFAPCSSLASVRKKARISFWKRLVLCLGWSSIYTVQWTMHTPNRSRPVSYTHLAGREPRYLIIGEGAARGDIEETIGTNRYPFCELLHGMSKDDLEKHYATCDMTCLLYTSRCV